MNCKTARSNTVSVKRNMFGLVGGTRLAKILMSTDLSMGEDLLLFDTF